MLDDEVAIFNAGSGGFILLRHYQEEWAANSMMSLMVDDLDAWWHHLESLELEKNFGVPAPKPPALQPWGLRIAYVVDPSGVLWHVAQRRDGAVHDRYLSPRAYAGPLALRMRRGLQVQRERATPDCV